MAEKKKDFLGKAWSAVSTLLPIVSPIATLMRVGRTDGKAFTDPVTFHLHPTFNPDTRTVSPVNNEATLECFAWGAFTAGVVVGGQGGKPTRLELDLSELPDAPALFKSR